MEREEFEGLVRAFTEEYGLDGVSDRVLMERAAMNLIRLGRAEAYEAARGLTERSVLWGSYISRMENTLRGFLNDLAVTRGRRKRLEAKEALMVDIEDLLERFAQRAAKRQEAEDRKRPGRVVRKFVFRARPLEVYERILTDWRRDKALLEGAKSEEKNPREGG